MSLSHLSPDALADMHVELTTAYADLVGKGLKLDLTRGREQSAPAPGDLSPGCSPPGAGGTARVFSATRTC